MKDLYTQYLETKLGFTENLVNSLLKLYDRGGTIPVFPTYDEWEKKVLSIEPLLPDGGYTCHCGAKIFKGEVCTCGRQLT